MTKAKIVVRVLAIVFIIGLTIGFLPALASSKKEKTVTIYRDVWGVPHIYGDTEKAVFFAFGYAQAEDHLLTILQFYRQATGTLAEAFGPGPNNVNIKSDFNMKLFGIPQRFEENWDLLDPDVEKMTKAFADGINAYIDEHKSELPTWATTEPAYPVKATHVLAWAQLIAFGVEWQSISADLNTGKILAALGPETYNILYPPITMYHQQLIPALSSVRDL